MKEVNNCEQVKPLEMGDGTMHINHAVQWAQSVSKLPGGHFTLAYYPYSRSKGVASNQLVVKEGCTYRTQMPHDKISIDGDNLFLFNDSNGEPKMCYRALIRFMGFPIDNYKLHKIVMYNGNR